MRESLLQRYETIFKKSYLLSVLDTTYATFYRWKMGDTSMAAEKLRVKNLVLSLEKLNATLTDDIDKLKDYLRSL